MTKILIIEDEPSIADNIIYALKSEGFEPVWKATGRDGLKAFQEGAVSLLVVDVGLPDMSGFDVCREIRKTSDVPVIFLTARAGEIDRIVGLEIGADDYMVKPFSPRELTARIRAILRRSVAGRAQQSMESPAKPPTFSIDEERLKIYYFGRDLELTKNEFLILKVLIKKPGQVYSRERLMDLAWDDPSCLDRTVDAHIKSIRQKMKAVNPDIDAIETRRGFGYSLREGL